MKKIRFFLEVLMISVLALGSEGVLCKADSRNCTDETRIISQITNLPYIGGQRMDTPMIMEQDRKFMKPVDEEGILGCLKRDFDNDQKEEILAVTYEGREDIQETGKSVRVSMYEQQEDSWIISDMFELVRYDFQGMPDEMTTMSDSGYAGFEGNLFLRKANGQYQFFYECNRSSKYLATGYEWYFMGYTYDGNCFKEMEQTSDLYYGGSGLEADCLFSLDPEPLYDDNYSQNVIGMIEAYQSLGFQAERLGGDGYTFYSTVSQDPYCYLLVRLIRGDRLDAAVVNEWWANPSGDLEGFWIDLEDYTSQIGEIQECAVSEPEQSGLSELFEENPYEEFLKTNGVGSYYAILPAGENQEPILIISDSFPEQDADTFVPDLGYGITIYGNNNGNVYQIGDYTHISEAAGPWRFYGNKLMGSGRRGGYFTVDIAGDFYEMNFHPDDENVYANWEAITLLKNRGSGETQTSNTGNSVSGNYILPNSSTEYLTEEQLIRMNLTGEQLRLARNEIYARYGRRFKTAEIQAYFDAQTWYVPKYEPEEFDAIEDDVLNPYEKYNLALIKSLEK